MKYDSGAVVELGNVLTPTQVNTAILSCTDILHVLYIKVQNAPTVTWPAEDGALYTLIMTGLC